MSRRARIEAQLAESPDDSFLNYAWALQVAGEGDLPPAIDRLKRLLDRDRSYVPAWFQLAQLQVKAGEIEPARQTLTQGIEVARTAGDSHAEGEMRGFLDGLT